MSINISEYIYLKQSRFFAFEREFVANFETNVMGDI